MSFTESGLIGASFFAGYSVGQIPWGYFSDRLGGKKAITIGIIGLAVFSVLFGSSRSIDEIVVWRAIAGLLGAGIFVPSIKVLSESFDKVERALVLGLFIVGMSVGFVVAPIISVLIAAHFTWRGSILFFAFFTLAFTPLVWLWLKQVSANKKDSWSSRGLRLILRKPFFWILTYDHILRFGVIFVLISWIPIYLSENYNFSIVSAGLILSFMNVIAIFSTPLGGLLSRRVGEIPVIMFSFMAFAITIFFINISSSYLLLWILALSMGFLAFLHLGPLWSLSISKTPKRLIGILTGYYNTCGSVGALILPFLIGFLKDFTGSFTTGWIFVASSCMIGVIVTWVLTFNKVQ